MIRFSVHYFLLFVSMAALVPYLQVFLQARGFDKAQIGYLQGVLALAGICGPMVLARVADRFGRHKWFIVGCFAGYIFLLLPMGVTTSAVAASILMAAIGFVNRPALPLTDALASAELPDPVHQYGRARAWGSASFVLSLFAFRLLGWVDEGSSASMMRMMVLTAWLCIASSMLLPDSGRPPEPSRATEAEKPHGHFATVFWLFLLATAAQRFGMAAYYSFFTLYLHDKLGMDKAAWVWALGAMVETPVVFFAGRLIRRFGLQTMLIAAMLGASARLAIYAFVPVLPVVLASQVFHALTFGCFHVASIEFIRRTVPVERRGMAMALYMSLALGVTASVGSGVGGVVIEQWGYKVLYGTYALAPLLGVAIMVAARRQFALASAKETPPDRQAQAS